MYKPLFSKILDSSIWLESAGTRLVWLTLIAAMDEGGLCLFASTANLAHRARVTPEDAADAVKVLESPDSNSADSEHEGRRIERVAGGWRVLNAGKYRELARTATKREQTRERVARHRETHPKPPKPPKPEPASPPPDAPPAEPPPPPKPPVTSKPGKNVPTEPLPLRLGALYHRKPSTAWSQKEIDAYKRCNPSEEDIALVEAYYADEMPKGEAGVHRRDLGTLLNNFQGEVDRAIAHKALKEKPANAPRPQPSQARRLPSVGSAANTHTSNRGAVSDYGGGGTMGLGLAVDGEGNAGGVEQAGGNAAGSADVRE